MYDWGRNYLVFRHYYKDEIYVHKYVQRRRKFSLKGKVVISIAFVKPFDYDHFDSTSDHDSFGAKKGRAS